MKIAWIVLGRDGCAAVEILLPQYPGLKDVPVPRLSMHPQTDLYGRLLPFSSTQVRHLLSLTALNANSASYTQFCYMQCPSCIGSVTGPRGDHPLTMALQTQGLRQARSPAIPECPRPSLDSSPLRSCTGTPSGPAEGTDASLALGKRLSSASS